MTYERILSMTGFSNEHIKKDGFTITCEMKSLNHRYRDIYIHLPEGLYKFEETIYNKIKKAFHRGKYDIYIKVEKKDNKSHLNVEAVKEHFNNLESIKKQLDIPGEIDMSILLDSLDFNMMDLIPDIEYKEIEQVVNITLEGLKKAQSREGNILKKVCMDNLKELEKLWKVLNDKSSNLIKNIRERLKETIYNSFNDDYDKDRLEQEIVYFAERANITEELDRLKSHIDYFREVIDCGSPCGKKLNFITQEMHRESETVLAKSSNLEISRVVVDIKSNIENLREQVQNIV
jgi:uncharacterized protein (TIGR00255 family)